MTAAADRLESHWRLLHPSKYLSAADLRGQPRKVKIKDFNIDDLPREGSSETERAVLIEFDGVTKKLVCNKTNLRAIAEIHGDYAADWRGKWVELYPTKKEKDGKPIKKPGTKTVVESIRIRAPGGKESATTEAAADGSQEPTA